MGFRESDDRLAIIALTTPLGFLPGEAMRVAPLTLKEWSVLRSDANRIGSLYDALAEMDHSLRYRADELLARCGQVKSAVRELEDRGIWVATLGEDGYPSRWSTRLAASSPPVVYGAGKSEDVERPSIGIVGSREIADRLVTIANDLGAAAVLGGYGVVSGGARGTDRIGMNGALEVGGHVIGVLPDHLRREYLRRANNDELRAGRLTLLSIVHPDTPFSVGNAMARNRLIYAQSQLTIVVSASMGTGGTWSGAVENLKRRWAPVYVWTGECAPEANFRLVEQGAMALPTIPQSSDDMRALVHDATADFERRLSRSDGAADRQLGFFGK